MNDLFDENIIKEDFIKNRYNFQDIILDKNILPIYIIQAHGSYDIRMKNDNNNNVIFDDDNIKNIIELKENRYIIDTTPLLSNQISSKNDVINMKKIINNPDRFKEEIFSNKFNDVCRYFSNIEKHHSEILVGPPRYYFPNKIFYFVDSDKKYNFDMGIFEVCNETKKLNIEINKGYNNKTLPDKLHRIWNYYLKSDKLFSKKNLNKGNNIKKIIEQSIKKGECVTLEDIIKILGVGIFIIFSCSDIGVIYENKQIELYEKRKSKQTKKQITKNNCLYKKCYESLFNLTEKLKDNWYDMVYTVNLSQKTRRKKDVPYLLRNRFNIKYKNNKLVSKYYRKKHF